MPSSIFPLLTSFFFLLTLDLCSPSPPGPTGPSGPTGPNPPGYSCIFAPVSDDGPSTTTPEYNARLVSQYSVSEFIQCAGEFSGLQISGDDSSRISALEVLVNATMTCGQYKLSEVIQNYSKTDQKVKLTQYLCGAANNSDVCSLSGCLQAKNPEHSLQGVCQNDNVNLWDNPQICGSSNGDNQAPAATTDEPNGMAAASSSMTATTTLPTQTASSSPVGSPSTSLGSSSNASSKMLAAGFGELTAAGVSLIVLMASL